MEKQGSIGACVWFVLMEVSLARVTSVVCPR